jgi:hypothetical protein
MKNLEQNLLKMMRWKKSNAYIAKKLNVTESEAKKIMSDFKLKRKTSEGVIESKVDLDKNQTELKGISFNEPKTPEEIIKLLKIDTSKWKLSSYWNKQQSDHWVISALVTQKTLSKEEILTECLSSFNPEYTPLKKSDIHINDSKEEVCAVISLQDLHFGKTGNEDVKHRIKSVLNNLCSTLYTNYKVDKIIYVLGGDLLNTDTFNGTTTSGTIVDSSYTAVKMYEEAFNTMYYTIHNLKQFCNVLNVVYIPGNHDRLSSFHLAHALENSIRDQKIEWDCDYSERKVATYGINMFGVEHGDVKINPLIYATEFPETWGLTKNRVIYTGHYHIKKTTTYITENEIHGVSVKVIPSLSNVDYWHYHNKYTGAKKTAVMDIYSPTEGKIAEYTVSF